DWTIALSMVAGTMFGVELGVRILGYFKVLGVSSVAVLVASLTLMITLFIYTTNETRRSHRSLEQAVKEGRSVGHETVSGGLTRFFQSVPLAPIVRCRAAGIVISMWMIVGVGLVTGTLAGFLGVGGGFVRVPALVYLIGASTHVAVGTDLVEIAFSGAYGTLRHSIEGNVDFLAVMFMLSGAVVGAQFGAISTAFVRGPAIRYILSYSLGLAAFSALLPLIDTLTGSTISWLMSLAIIVTLGQMIFLCTFILSMLAFALLARRDRWVPDWVMPLLVRPTVRIVEPQMQLRTEEKETI
nr:sulfite exporter TauE/SafE family protein [Dehalococcoidales bacterium]